MDESQATILVGARLYMSIDDEVDDLLHPFPRSTFPGDAGSGSDALFVRDIYKF